MAEQKQVPISGATADQCASALKPILFSAAESPEQYELLMQILVRLQTLAKPESPEEKSLATDEKPDTPK